MAILSPPQVAQYAYKAGFRGDALNTAVAVALAESGGNTHAYNPELAAGTPQGSGSRGLWQIYGGAHPHFNNDSMYDPAANAAAAYRIFREGGNSFRAWSTYNQGLARPSQNYAAMVGNKIVNKVKQLTGKKTPTKAAAKSNLANQLQIGVAGQATQEQESLSSISPNFPASWIGDKTPTDIYLIAIGTLLLIIGIIFLMINGYVGSGGSQEKPPVPKKIKTSSKPKSKIGE